MKKYRAAIIGLGRTGSLFNYIDPARKEIWTHAGAYKVCQRTELVAACDILDEKINLFSKIWGKVNFYKDYKEMLAKEKPDIVSICTWPELHSEMVLESIKAGVKAIYCEKPISYTLKEADEIIKKAKEKDVVLAINFQRRWEANFMKVKELIDNGEIGKIQTIVGYVDTALLENSIHLIDLFRYYGRNIDWLSAELDRNFVRIVEGKADPGAIINFGFRNGTRGFLKATGKTRFYHEFELDIYGLDGRIRVTDYGREFELWKPVIGKFHKGYFLPEKQNFPYPEKNERMVEAINNILNATEKKEECKCTGEDGKAALEIVIAAHKSGKEKRKIKLPLKLTEKLMDNLNYYKGLNLSDD